MRIVLGLHENVVFRITRHGLAALSNFNLSKNWREQVEYGICDGVATMKLKDFMEVFGPHIDDSTPLFTGDLAIDKYDVIIR